MQWWICYYFVFQLLILLCILVWSCRCVICVWVDVWRRERIKEIIFIVVIAVQIDVGVYLFIAINDINSNRAHIT